MCLLKATSKPEVGVAKLKLILEWSLCFTTVVSEFM